MRQTKTEAQRPRAVSAALACCLFALSVANGCSSSSASPSSGGSPGQGGQGGGVAGQAGLGGQGGGNASLYGVVSVQLKEEESYTDFAASFRDGPFPPSSDKGPLVASMTQGDCQLLEPVGCEPSCAATSVCTGKNQCSPRSKVINAGTLAVTGLGSAGSLTLEPQGNVYVISPTLAFPGCSEGASVTAQASLFTLASKCVAALHVTTPQPVRARAGGPIVLAWTAPAQAGASRVQISVEISHHGGYKGQIDCDVADTGAFSVPEPLVTALNGLGRAGFPTISLSRTATAVAPTAPHVSLSVSSTVVLSADTGIISCAGNDECTAPATCAENRTCQ